MMKPKLMGKTLGLALVLVALGVVLPCGDRISCDQVLAQLADE